MFRVSSLSIAVFTAGLQMASAQDHHSAEHMVITGVQTDVPLTVTTDPKRPRQPLPAHDGADYLKTIPGFSVIRKGGTDGDPVLRGMAGSRLSMLIDGEVILGGCNNRMDPPTAYVFPETFDAITVIKGPQSVQYGPGNSAGVVLFERNSLNNDPQGWKLHASALAGSYGRHDEVLDSSYTGEKWEFRGSVSNAEADNYEDGDGVEVHSVYSRWNAQVDLAWTPDSDTRFSIGTAFSDGEAAYADRGVDGSKFKRENLNLKFEKINISELIKKVELQTYYNYVDHVMDNYSLRVPSGMMSNPVAMNPDRTTTGAKFIVDLAPTSALELTLGIDAQRNDHSSRNTMNQSVRAFESLPRVSDTRFNQTGIFTELTWNLGADSRLVSGLRADRWTYKDLRSSIPLGMMNSVENPLAGYEREEVLTSGFLRIEDRLSDSGFTWFAGVGVNERFPDYWEIIKETNEAVVAADTLQAERNTQFDAGVIYGNERLNASVSVFYSDVKDYIMIQSGVMKAGAMGGMSGMDGMAMSTMRSATIARNVDARSWGVEVDSQYRLSDNWRAEFTLASVRGTNLSDNTHLAQLPPFETRVGIHYDNQVWSAGVLWRSLASQQRVDVGKGNIVGQDIGETSAANVFSLNAGWKAGESLLVTAGIDNLFDETYAEHISRAGALIAGFEQTTRINEPGRMMWVKAQYSF